MKRTRWPGKVVDFRYAAQQVRTTKLEAERASAPQPKPSRQSYAMAFVPEDVLNSGRLWLNEDQERFLLWLCKQPDDVPLSYWDMKIFAEILARLVLMTKTRGGIVELVRLDTEDVDDGGGTRLAQVG
jgi:hypothetical protein